MGSYYDVDAILTDAQKVPGVFKLDVPGLGYLEGSAGATLSKGTKVELPLWLAEMLARGAHFSSSAFVELDLPDALSPRVMNALKADPRTVNLRALAPHFYALGAQVLDPFEHDEEIDLLIETFQARAATIADQANNPRGALGEGAEFLRGLDETERRLFRIAHDGAKDVRNWVSDNKK